ncbi:MAG: redoxin domain-containing protein [Proteobacteria bacterium]|nr:MAG: redoxin domain-containing protein [Pseudomonadota bacterium]
MQSKNIVRVLLSLGVIAVLTAAFVVFNQYARTSKLDNKEYERREVARDFDLPVLGKSQYLPVEASVALKSLRGKPVLLHFWASWCAVCREEKPDIDAFWAKHKDEDILVVGVASFDTKVAMDDSQLIAKPSFTVILDEDGAVANNYKVSALPVSVLIDDDGYIVRTFKGTLKPYDFAAIETYLSSRKKAH